MSAISMPDVEHGILDTFHKYKYKGAGDGFYQFYDCTDDKVVNVDKVKTTLRCEEGTYRIIAGVIEPSHDNEISVARHNKDELILVSDSIFMAYKDSVESNINMSLLGDSLSFFSYGYPSFIAIHTVSMLFGKQISGIDNKEDMVAKLVYCFNKAIEWGKQQGWDTDRLILRDLLYKEILGIDLGLFVVAIINADTEEDVKWSYNGYGKYCLYFGDTLITDIKEGIKET